jgi:hypothetical protein
MREQQHIGQKSILVLVRLAAMWILVTKAAAASVAIVDIGNHGVGCTRVFRLTALAQTSQSGMLVSRRDCAWDFTKNAACPSDYSDFVLSLCHNPNKRFKLSLPGCQNSFMGFVEAPSLQEHHQACR